MVKVAAAPPTAESETDQVETESREAESPAADETAYRGLIAAIWGVELKT